MEWKLQRAKNVEREKKKILTPWGSMVAVKKESSQGSSQDSFSDKAVSFHSSHKICLQIYISAFSY
jgi:hypothetical protein